MKFSNKSQGFTLVEVVIVLVIGGLILSGLASAFSSYIRKSKVDDTKDKLQIIQLAIQDYVNVNNKLPCVASTTEEPETNEFAKEVSANCASGAHPGTIRVAGRAGEMVRIGSVPVRSLNLPDQYIIDGWRGRFVYAVTERMAVPGSFTSDGGAVSIVDSIGNSSIVPAGHAHYAVISAGPDNLGVTSFSGASTGDCASGTLDEENCNGDATFRKTLVSSDISGPGHYDDFIIYQTATRNEYDIPAGAVMAFNLGTCPSGWTSFAQASGRTIVGTGNYNAAYNPAGRLPWTFTEDYALLEEGGYATWVMNNDELPTHSHAVPMDSGVFEPSTPSSPGSQRSFHEAATTDSTRTTLPVGIATPIENRPPYIALLYCVKI